MAKGKEKQTCMAIVAIATSPAARTFSDALDVIANEALKTLPPEIAAAILAYTIGEIFGNADDLQMVAAQELVNGHVLHGRADFHAAMRKRAGGMH